MTIGYITRKSWLTEIKQPLPFKEWFHSTEVEALAYHFNDRDAAEAICVAWVENQKLVDNDKDHKVFRDWISGINPSGHEIWSAALRYGREQ